MLVETKGIPSHPEAYVKEDIETVYQPDGLRILGRMIARRLIKQKRTLMLNNQESGSNTSGDNL